MIKGEKVLSERNPYRRVFGPPDKRFLNPAGSATSRAFVLKPKDEGKLSVDVREMTTPEMAVIDKMRFVLFEISVRKVENLSLAVIHDPLTLEMDNIENPSHALILGLQEDDEITPSLLAKLSNRVYF